MTLFCTSIDSMMVLNGLGLIFANYISHELTAECVSLHQGQEMMRESEIYNLVTLCEDGWLILIRISRKT